MSLFESGELNNVIALYEIIKNLNYENIFHYRDDYGPEINVIYQFKNGEYALIEIKTGNSRIL